MEMYTPHGIFVYSLRKFVHHNFKAYTPNSKVKRFTYGCAALFAIRKLSMESPYMT